MAIKASLEALPPEYWLLFLFLVIYLEAMKHSNGSQPKKIGNYKTSEMNKAIL